jgi:hypothetical protein
VSFLSTFACVATEETVSRQYSKSKATKKVETFYRLIAPVADKICRGYFCCLKTAKEEETIFCYFEDLLYTASWQSRWRNTLLVI